MPIAKRWSPSEEEHIKQNVPDTSGIYELWSFGELVYIGTSENLRQRLHTHEKEKDPNQYRFKEVSRGWFGFGKGHIKAENDHLTRFEEKHDRLPKWNKADTR